MFKNCNSSEIITCKQGLEGIKSPENSHVTHMKIR